MTMIRFDFRSDTVTRPTEAMRAAMAAAEVGDDVLGDDPTVNALEAKAAAILGKEAAILLPSGTQSNLIAIMVHCERGDEYIVGQHQHCYRWEAGGAAVLGSVQPQPIANQDDGSLALADIAAAVKPDDFHFARTRLLALENTIGGKVLDQGYVASAVALARRHGLACHLDGARLFNAAVAQGASPADLAAPFDTVSICLSKGLGAPVGSMLVGGKDHIAKARRLRKMLGGGMRQAGVLAAAGLHALDHHVDRLADDHARARRLANVLDGCAGIKVARMPDTNIIFVDLDPAIAEPFSAHLSAHGVGVITTYGRQRWVTHLDVDDDAVDETVRIIRRFEKAQAA